MLQHLTFVNCLQPSVKHKINIDYMRIKRNSYRRTIFYSVVSRICEINCKYERNP